MSPLINFFEAPELIKKHFVLSRFIIAEGVELKHKGKEAVGLCPFHEESTPSFSVNDEKGVYLCRGCRATGDIISFVATTKGLSTGKAIRHLAERMGLKIRPTPEARQHDRKPTRAVTQEDRALMVNVHDHVAQVAHRYMLSLLRDPADPVSAYILEERRISLVSVHRFGLGYLPSDRTLWELVSTPSEINPDPTPLTQSHWRVIATQAGLLSSQYDKSMFQGRLLFPIANNDGKCVGFSGRVIPSLVDHAVMGERKYLNSPETLVFDKSKLLYGLTPWHFVLQNKAASQLWRQTLNQSNYALVEGFTDVIRLGELGVRAVAAMGTAITDHQLSLIFSRADTLCLLTDGDGAGLEATNKALLKGISQMKAGFNLYAAYLPDGEDPDTYFEELANYPDPADHFWHLVNGLPRRTPEQEWFDVCVGRVANPVTLADQVRIEQALSDNAPVPVTSDPIWRLSLIRYVADVTGYFTRPFASMRSAYFSPQTQSEWVLDDTSKFWLYRIARAPEILRTMTVPKIRSWWVNDAVNGLLADALECPPALRLIFQAARAVSRNPTRELRHWPDLAGALLDANFPSALLVAWSNVLTDGDRSLTGLGYSSEMLAPDLWVVEFQDWVQAVENTLNKQLHQALNWSSSLE